jgi:hypothetical protein
MGAIERVWLLRHYRRALEPGRSFGLVSVDGENERMVMSVGIPQRGTIERAVERVRRTVKSMQVHSDLQRRRQLTEAIHRDSKLDHLIDETLGYAMLPFGTIDNVAPAIEFARRIQDERSSAELPKEKRELIVLSEPDRYEDAPEFFELALSDQVLQIVTDYLGEVPKLRRIKLWWTPVNTQLKGSQLYHRDGMNWYQRQAKFLFIMNDVDETCGPFTFIPANVSRRVANSLGSIRDQERVTDELVYQHARPSDAISLIGPAGTGAVVDSSRCFHYGARARGGERLMLVFNFMPSLDCPSICDISRSPGFEQRFGDDPVRRLLLL